MNDFQKPVAALESKIKWHVRRAGSGGSLPTVNRLSSICAVRSRDRKELLSTKLENAVEAIAFIYRLAEIGLLFHFDDSPETIVNCGGGKETFTKVECAMVRCRVGELFALLADPFEHSIDASGV